MIVNFYQLGAIPLERVLPSICQSLVTGGEKVLVVAADDSMLARLDEQLWTFSADSFLPHGRAPAESQPVLLSTVPEAANGARSMILADGRWREEALGFDRAYHFFDDSGLEPARDLWRALKTRPEVDLRYWKRDGGRWVEGP